MRTGLGALSIAAALLFPGAVAAAPGVTVIGGAGKETTAVPLNRVPSGELTGELKLAVRAAAKGRLVVRYVPAGTAPRAAVADVRQDGEELRLEAGEVGGLALVAKLPREASPSDLDGVLVLELRDGGRRVGDPVELQITGTGNSLPGVTLQPAEVTMQVTSWWGPLDGEDHERADVLVRGPGVPALFRRGVLPFKTSLLLRTEDGNSERASLAVVADGDEPTVARGIIRLDGNISAGKYTAEQPISSFSLDSPKLSVEMNVAHGFAWALLMVLLGSVAGGALYLGSAIKRRRDLMREELIELVERYRGRCDELRGTEIWTLESALGPEENWYQVTWTALPELDGVRGVWSSLHWARSDEDFEETAGLLDGLKQKILRWLKAAEGVDMLSKLHTLHPKHPPKGWTKHPEELRWTDTVVVDDTNNLLRRLKTIPQPDDAATQALADRIGRHVRWHSLVANVWHMHAVMAEAVVAPGNDYTEEDRRRVAEMDPYAIARDEEAREAKRTEESQLVLEGKLDNMKIRLRGIYTGDQPEELELREGDERVVELGLLSAKGARQGLMDSTLEAEPDAANRTTTRRRASKLSGGVERDGDTVKIPTPVRAILRRDAIWTAAIALVTVVAYIPTLYGPTWGSFGDYVGAFAAGFLGKAVINWAALPAFRSLRRWKKPGDGGSEAPAQA